MRKMKKVDAAINAIPGITKITTIYDHPNTDFRLWWFDCSLPGQNVVGFPAKGTFAILMEGPNGKAFVDPVYAAGWSFVTFPDADIQSASALLASDIVANLLGGAA